MVAPGSARTYDLGGRYPPLNSVSYVSTRVTSGTGKSTRTGFCTITALEFMRQNRFQSMPALGIRRRMGRGPVGCRDGNRNSAHLPGRILERLCICRQLIKVANNRKTPEVVKGPCPSLPATHGARLECRPKVAKLVEYPISNIHQNRVSILRVRGVRVTTMVLV